MPAIPLNRYFAWNAWMRGQVAGTNAGLDITDPDIAFDMYDFKQNATVTKKNSPRVIANLAMKQNYNAIRLWLPLTKEDFTIFATATNEAIAWSSGIVLPSTGTPISALRDKIIRILDAAAKLDIGIIFVINSIGDAVTHSNAFNQDTENLRKAIVFFWQETIKQFSDHTALIGVDIMNEPPHKGVGTENYSIADFQNAKYGWPTLAKDIIKAIRDQEVIRCIHEQPIPILVGSLGGYANTMQVFNSPSPSGASSSCLDDPALTAGKWRRQSGYAGASGWIVYTFHYYGAEAITHQGIYGDSWAQLGWTYPAGTLRPINRGFDSVSGQPIDEAVSALAEGWGNKTQAMNDTDDVLAQWAAPIALSSRMKQTTGKTQPIWLGEFSFVQPVLEAVYPPDPYRANLAWGNTTPLRTRSTVVAGSELGKYTPIWNDLASHPKSRWITELEVFIGANGKKYIRAYFDNISRKSFGASRTWIYPDPPEAPVSPIFPSTSNMQRTNRATDLSVEWTQFAMGFPVLATRQPDKTQPDPAKWSSDRFKNTVRMQVTPGNDPNANLLTPAGQVTVELQADRFWVEYLSPDQNATSNNNVPRQALDTVANQYPAVALACFFSATDGATMENSRLAYIQDVLCAAQECGFSWTYFDEVTAPGSLCWRPTPAINGLLRQAAFGRKIPRRA